MSALFGGILLFLNLRDLNKKTEAYIVLSASFVLTIFTIFIVNYPATSFTGIASICGAISGCIYNYYFIPKYIPNEENYPKKAIWKPLIIAVGIVIFFVSLMIYGNAEI